MGREGWIPRSIPPLQHSVSPSNTSIVDIRSSDSCPLDNLASDILDGLSQPYGHKTLPTLLLWDEKGQTLYDDVLAADDYYPYRVEHELLQARVDEIASTIADSRTELLIELGAGNMSKTAQLLSSLDKRLRGPLVYYALDVDQAQLERSLLQLKDRTGLRWIKLCGLLGTYEDGARWLARPEIVPFRRTLVWMGSSIANCEQHEASELLKSFAHDPKSGAPQTLAGFLLLVDGCQDADRISVAYNIPSGETRRWMMHALEAARKQLNGQGDDAEVDRIVADENWRFEGQWHPKQQRYQNYLVPTRDIVGVIQGHQINLKKGERVKLLHSGKWTETTINSVASKPGLEVRRAWHDDGYNYGELLKRCLQ
jgi:EasF-like predicted methyltransferase